MVDCVVIFNSFPTYSTVFTRKTFTVEDPALIQRAVLLVDYDDAYVAYINGEEVARGEGVSKREAQHQAARRALVRLGLVPED